MSNTAALSEYARFNAGHSELHGLMLDTVKADDERMCRLIDRHLKPLYEGLVVYDAMGDVRGRVGVGSPRLIRVEKRSSSSTRTTPRA